MEMCALVPSCCYWMIPYLVSYTWIIFPHFCNQIPDRKQLGGGGVVFSLTIQRIRFLTKTKGWQSVSGCLHLGKSGKTKAKCLCTFSLLFFLVHSSPSPLSMMPPTFKAGLSEKPSETHMKLCFINASSVSYSN